MSSVPERPPRFPLLLNRVGASTGPAAPLRPLPAAAAAVRPRETLRPQRPLHEAARDAARKQAPQGLGLDSVQVRERMVWRLRQSGVRSEPLCEAMRQVPRHVFVDTALAIQAYEDTSLPIGYGQTISKPSVVARMIDLLFDSATARQSGHLGRTLEIGTGCGYQTAVLAQLAKRVISIERLRPLYDKATTHLAAWRMDHVRLMHGDGMLGHAPSGPYDSIIAAAGGDDIPQAWLDQLAVGGRLVAPMHRGRGQVLVVVDRHERGCVHTEFESVHFVPLKSGVV